MSKVFGIVRFAVEEDVEAVLAAAPRARLLVQREGTLWLSLLHVATMQGRTGVVRRVGRHCPELVATKDKLGRLPLHLACLRRDEASVSALLGMDATTSCMQDDRGVAPLHVASQLGAVGCMRQLLDRGADVSARDEHGATPLHYAQDAEAAEMLLEAGASLHAVNKNGETPLHVVCFAILVQDASKGPDTRWRQALRCSVQLVRGEVDAVELSGSPTPGHGAEEAEEGPSPPHFLSEWMNEADAALATSPLPVDEDGGDRSPGGHNRRSPSPLPSLSPLPIGGEGKEARFSSPRAPIARPRVIAPAPTPLAAPIAQQSSPAGAKEGAAAPRRLGPEDLALLREACAEPQRPSVLPSRIGTAGAGGQGQGSRKDWEAHHRAEGIHLARFRLAQRGIDWRRWAPTAKLHDTESTSQDEGGAARKEEEEAVRSPSPPATSAAWQKGLQLAATARKQAAPAHDTEGRRALLAHLLDADAARKGSGERAVDVVDARGRTGVHWAASRGHQDLLLRLLRAGAACTQVDRNGMAPIHYAAASGDTECVDMLLAHGASPEQRTEAGWTPLHYAAHVDSMRTALRLHAAGAAVEPRTERENTPLHFACGHASEELVDWLLDHGCSLFARNRAYRLPIYFAAAQGREQLAQRLLKRFREGGGEEGEVHTSSRRGKR